MKVFKPDFDMLAFRLKLGGSRIKKRAFLSTGSLGNKQRLLPGAKALHDLGVEIYATEGTSKFFTEHGVQNVLVNKISEETAEPNVLPLLREGRFDLVVNVRTGDASYDEVSDAKIIRNFALEYKIPLIVDVDFAVDMIDRMVSQIMRERSQKGPRPSMREYFAGLVHDRGGYADNHGHYDKSYLITPDTLGLGQIDMQEKWRLYRQLKEGYTHDDLIERITRCVEFRMSQGVYYMRTMVDADTMVELKCIEAALEVKRRFTGKAVIEIGIQPLEGVLESGPRKWVEKACGMADFIGGLPSRDKLPEAHLDFILGMGKEMGKRVDVHVDQKGVPWENETQMLALKTVQHKLEGRVSAVHSIISRKSLHEQQEIAKLTASAGVTVVVCPGAEISMSQPDMQGQLSNCIPPVPLYQEHGTKVVYGSDNTEDPFMPFSDGDPWIETRMLMDAVRSYTAPQIADVMCDKSLFEEKSLAEAA
jgi:cytosine deaminase